MLYKVKYDKVKKIELEQCLENCKDFKEKICKYFEENPIANTISLKNEIIKYYHSNSNWVKNWLWYSEGNPSLAPFGTDLDFNEIVKGVDRTTVNNELIALKQKKKNIERYYDFKSKDTSLNIVTIADTLYKIDKRILGIKGNTDDNNNGLLQKDLLLYSGKIYFNVGCYSSPKGKTFVRIHDNDESGKLQNQVRDNYDVGTEVVILLNNVSEEIPFKQSVKYFTEDTSPLTAELLPVIDKLGSFLNLPDVTKVKNMLLGLEYKTMNFNGSPDTCKTTCTISDTEKVPEINKSLKYFSNSLKFQQGFDVFQDNALRPLLHTQENIGTTIDTGGTSYNTKYCFRIKQDTVRFAYRVNKLYRFWPAVGFVYGFDNDPEVVLSKDTPLKSTYYNGLKIVPTIKIHPWRVPIMDPNFVISGKRKPVIDYRKFYFSLGFSAVKPTREFFVGAGIDLWSGLSITGGLQMVRKDQYKYVNGEIDKKPYLDWKNFYFGISMDVTLAMKLISFFVKQ